MVHNIDLFPILCCNCYYAPIPPLQVLYRQKWDETKDRYLLPPDAPELVLAVKNAANYSKVEEL